MAYYMTPRGQPIIFPQNNMGGILTKLNYDEKVLGILTKGQKGIGLTKEECRYLLNFNESSPESSLMRAVAND
jgi:hypothetical protein